MYVTITPCVYTYNNRQMQAQTLKKVYVTLFLVFVCLPIYCVYTQYTLTQTSLKQLLLSAVAKAIKVSVYFPVPVYPINTHKMNNSANPDDFLNTSIGFNFNIYIC